MVDKEYGLFEVAPSGLKFISNNPTFMREEVRCILALNSDEYLVGTFNNGIFLLSNNTLIPWEPALNKELSDNILYTGIKLANGFFAFGTIRNGIYITNSKGIVYQHLNRQKGLETNNVLSLF